MTKTSRIGPFLSLLVALGMTFMGSCEYEGNAVIPDQGQNPPEQSLWEFLQSFDHEVLSDLPSDRAILVKGTYEEVQLIMERVRSEYLKEVVSDLPEGTTIIPPEEYDLYGIAPYEGNKSRPYTQISKGDINAIASSECYGNYNIIERVYPQIESLLLGRSKTVRIFAETWADPPIDWVELEVYHFRDGQQVFNRRDSDSSGSSVSIERIYKYLESETHTWRQGAFHIYTEDDQECTGDDHWVEYTEKTRTI